MRDLLVLRSSIARSYPLIDYFGPKYENIVNISTEPQAGTKIFNPMLFFLQNIDFVVKREYKVILIGLIILIYKKHNIPVLYDSDLGMADKNNFL